MFLSPFIEHTNLNPCSTISEIDRLVSEAVEHRFFGICVAPFWVKRAKREIATEQIALITVSGFPLGHHMTETKLDEISRILNFRQPKKESDMCAMVRAWGKKASFCNNQAPSDGFEWDDRGEVAR